MNTLAFVGVMLPVIAGFFFNGFGDGLKIAGFLFTCIGGLSVWLLTM